MRILLADDQPEVRSAIRLLLEQQPESNEIEEVTNARELAHHIENCRPDLLLLDWDLPGSLPEKLLSGIQASCPNLITIVLDSSPQIRQVALKAGAKEFVSKNDPPERLLTAIRHFIESKK
jgi:DNA-binding NarL/FixJ family response regulator